MPHRLYGHVDAAENYSVGRWCADARAALAQARGGGPAADPRRRHRALFQGADARACPRCRRRRPKSAPRCGRGCDAQGAAALHAELARRDPAMAARLRPGDRMRIAPRAGSAGGDRPLARRLASRRHAGDPRSGAAR